MWSGVRDFFDFSRGSIDVLVVQQEDGSYASTPFHIRFGRGHLLREEEKVVYIEMNGEPVPVRMRLGEAGEAYFEVDPVQARKEKPEAQIRAEEREVQRAEETIEMAEEAAGPALPVAAAVADVLMEQPSSEPSAETPTEGGADQQIAAAVVDAVEQPGTRWTWGWGLLPSRRQVSSPVASPSASYSDLPKLSSFPEGENPLHDSTKIVSPTVPARPRRNSLHELLLDSSAAGGGYASDGDGKGGPEAGWKRKWGIGGLINMLKPKEATEPVYLIKPADSGFLSGFPDDDEDGEGMDEYFYSAVSPRECASPTGIPRNHSLEKLHLLDEVSRHFEEASTLERQADEIERELELEEAATERLADGVGLEFGTEGEREEGDDREAVTTEVAGASNDENEGKNEEVGAVREQVDATDPTKKTADESENESENESKSENGEKNESEATVDSGEVSDTNQSEDERERRDEQAEDAQEDSTNAMGLSQQSLLALRSLEEEQHWAAEQHVGTTINERREARGGEQANALKELQMHEANGDDAASDDETTVNGLPTPTMTTPTGSTDEAVNEPSRPKRSFDEEMKAAADVDVDAVELSNGDDGMAVALSLCGDLLPNTAFEMAERLFKEHRVSQDEYWKDPGAVLTDPRLVVRIRDKVYAGKDAVALIVSHMAFGPAATIEAAAKLTPLPQGKATKEDRAESSFSSASTMTTPTRSSSASSSWRWWWSSSSVPTNAHPDAKGRPSFTAAERRTLRPTSEQLSAMGLKEGANKATFLVRSETATQEVTAMIYLWSRFTKIVISDIDGTITKSDLLGHILPIVGRDWSHSGIAQLYSNIYENGYRILYVSSRSIGQANITRGYISTLRQDDVSLPEGPVFTSPNGLLRSVHREVIRRNPEEFKIACLKDIAALFPHGNPFYAGFGNRPSDALSYLTVGVPKGKIFTINQRGEISMSNRTYKRSYMKLNEVVHEMFPAINQPPPQEEFNQFQYWRLPELDIGELEPL